jgi:DtxR family transcriptional regulator, Mn-dependent transcriptional regulator
MLSFTEENYLKALLQITLEDEGKSVAGTNELAGNLKVKPATATDMLKKLKDKKLVDYEKYGKISLTEPGRRHAIEIVRKHRLWETFLFQKLSFTWDEVHEVAEQLEHIQSQKLIDRLDEFLEYPEFDPHGDVIPSAGGELRIAFKKTLADLSEGQSCKMVAVKDNTPDFLQYVVKVGLGINNIIKVISKESYDSLLTIEANGTVSNVSQKFAENILVVCPHCSGGKSCARSKCELK